ncbi:hypothetical protein COT68_01505 [bacterium (Candidatus Torokbacteria) CG09_land_8_20_14_0_10_42_11]|nr:MAG: hypothetical protein COT68_01505 [bacterium (Candidatus Torokbacteria) CG09_land_8_20_14_0_10_42_11]
MFEQALAKETKNVLALLNKQDWIQDFYLSGGTGLALQLGHRLSIDLDFFASQPFQSAKIIQRLSVLGEFILEQEAEGTVRAALNNVKLDFLFYPYPLLKPTAKYEKIKIAHPLDIALMKITAIASRGSKKDFIDLYLLCQKETNLKDLFALLPQKFAKVKYESYHLAESLIYFEDAESEPMPQMLMSIDWPTVKSFFQIEAKNLIQNYAQ